MTTATYDPNRPFVVGDRVRVTDVRTQIGSYPLGSGESDYVGKDGTVRNPDAIYVDFDDDDLPNHSSWSHAALDLIVSDEIKVGDTVRIVAATHASEHHGKVGEVASTTGDWEPHSGPLHRFLVKLPGRGTVYCSEVEKVVDEADTLGDGSQAEVDTIDEVAGPLDVNPNRPLVVGDRVRFRKTSWKSGGDSRDVGQMHGIVAGDEGVIIAESDYQIEDEEVTNYDVEWDKAGSRPSKNLHMSWIDPVVAEVASARPIIDFSADRYATARAYAADLESRILTDDSNVTLHDVAAGAKVDAYALNSAVLDAMRSCATRDSHSTARRERATRVAHLGHIVQATLENHADALPAYAEGERSRAVAAAKAEVASYALQFDSLSQQVDAKQRELDAVSTALIEQQQTNEDLRNERGTLTQAASDERRRLTDEIDALKDSVAVEKASVSYLQASLDYALAMLPATAQTKVAGFQDGYVKAKGA